MVYKDRSVRNLRLQAAAGVGAGSQCPDEGYYSEPVPPLSTEESPPSGSLRPQASVSDSGYSKALSLNLNERSSFYELSSVYHGDGQPQRIWPLFAKIPPPSEVHLITNSDKTLMGLVQRDRPVKLRGMQLEHRCPNLRSRPVIGTKSGTSGIG
ncbi:MAG: hypothetical protein M1835_005127 [Candelina submexicana]|nr:MAG: hypothetical protein M1835_005127 [Candelina submexicana]